VRRVLLLLLAAAAAGCTTPLAVGERLYREGDRLGALETWRAIPENSSESSEAQERIAVVEEEFNYLVDDYKRQARDFETNEQLAESILDYRLALKLQPDDADTLALVQQLARDLASRKAELQQQYDYAFGEGNLAAARRSMEQLRELDPFDPELQIDERQLHDALRLEVTRGLSAGRRQLIAGNHDEARRRFRQVLELDPDNESAREHISYIATLQLATLQREREATAERSASFASPERSTSEPEIRAKGFYREALDAEQLKDYEEAILNYDRALELDPKHRGAQRHLNEMRSLLAGRVGALIEKGRNFYRNEDLEMALNQWQLAELIDPDNERARAYVKRAKRQLQNLERLRSEPDVAGRRK
jgi:tetratricopeptide (TPR) repeat protein